MKATNATVAKAAAISSKITAKAKIKYDFPLHAKIENRILPEIPDAVNRNIKLMYQIIGNSEKEIYVKEWIIMSLNETLKKYKYYCENEQERIFDIAFRYMGMGHIEVLSCDLKTHLLFYRHDGGSSGWDRETNFQEMIKCDPETYQQFYFQNWIDYV